MASYGGFANTGTYHLLSYGTLLGSTLFQSFISGIIAFRVLPRPQFSVLQKNTFPIFFALQTVTPTLLILTYPSGPSTLSSHTLSASLIGTMLLTGLVNWVYVGPQTVEVMRLRKHQETRDGVKSYDKPEKGHSKEMQELNKRFGVLHGVSTLINLVGFGAMVWYGGVLGQRLVF